MQSDADSAKEQAWKDEVAGMKAEAKKELSAAKQVRREAEDMRERAQVAGAYWMTSRHCC